MKSRYHLLLSAMLIVCACDKNITEIDTPDFDVATSASVYKAGEKVKFNFTGKADIISIYPGEVLHDYAFKDNRNVEIKGTGASLQFSSSVQVGTQANQLSVLASTDFDGDYSSLTKIKLANWTDITSRFDLGTTAAFRNSGNIDVSDLIQPDKPLYIAFKYVTRPQATNGLARQWFIQSFSLTSNKLFNDKPLAISDQLNAGFRIVDEIPVAAPARGSITQSRITLYGNQYLTADMPIFDPLNPIFDPANPIYDPQSPSYNPNAVRPTYVPFDPSSPFNDPLSEHWAISKAINMAEVNLGPDRAVPIKGLRDAMLKSYEYTYTTPGTYKVVFVASNNTITTEQKVIREITLTILP